MNRNPRCLYNNSFRAFLHDAEMSALVVLRNKCHERNMRSAAAAGF